MPGVPSFQGFIFSCLAYEKDGLTSSHLIILQVFIEHLLIKANLKLCVIIIWIMPQDAGGLQ